MITIGIDASRAFAKSRSGIGEYARELIGALISNNYLFNNRRIILFVRPGQDVNHFSRKLPSNWNFRTIHFFPIFWSQLGLASMAHFLKVDVLFSPSHALPLLFNKKTVYVLHGLEMKEVPNCYPFFHRLINEWLLRKSLAKAWGSNNNYNGNYYYYQDYFQESKTPRRRKIPSVYNRTFPPLGKSTGD